MSEERPSDRMSLDELFARDLDCPDCDCVGQRTTQFAIGSAVMQYIEGLDLRSCEGCRRVLAAQGGVPIGAIDSNAPA